MRTCSVGSSNGFLGVHLVIGRTSLSANNHFADCQKRLAVISDYMLPPVLQSVVQMTGLHDRIWAHLTIFWWRTKILLEVLHFILTDAKRKMHTVATTKNKHQDRIEMRSLWISEGKKTVLIFNLVFFICCCWGGFLSPFLSVVFFLYSKQRHLL